MDTKESILLKYSHHTIPPAQLLIGNHSELLITIELFLKNLLCNYNACGMCATCIQLQTKQHHCVMWLYPEKQYTADSFDELLSSIIFTRAPHDVFFFIIQKADLLTPASANKLLKPMEEPPPGYYFILLAQQLEQIIPTIRSRCIIHTFESSSQQYNNHPLFACFTTEKYEIHEFSSLLETITVTEYETIEIVDAIITFWAQRYKDKSVTQESLSSIHATLTILEQARKKPPMPGSSLFFWRNLYVQLCQ